MPPQSPDALDNILKYTEVAANALQDVWTATQTPFLNSVCTLSLTIIAMVQNTKVQKERCLRIVEEIHHSLCALLALCIHSEDIRCPKMLDQIAEYALTLQKLHVCLKAQQESGTIKRLLKQNEITAQLESCERELRAASEVLTTQFEVGIATALLELNIDTERRHQELLELISSRSASMDTASSIDRSSLNQSSDSISLLPAAPQIFHGRESELNDLVGTLLGHPARAAILGAGGMGKTTLAMAAVHHPAVREKYTLTHFISCESANTCGDLVIGVGLHLGLEPSPHLSKAIVQHFARCGPCLLVLDNFETPWEPLDFRGQVEEFISLLTGVPTLALLVTMRGAERPGKVKWNRPFLPPLESLSASASRQIFFDIAEEPEVTEQPVLDDLLDLSGSLPLAVSLMANIAAVEGYSATLSRWQIENTALLSDGADKRSNLEKSILLSLGSPRIAAWPHAKDLISLLSLLPDGIRAEDIIGGKVPIHDVRKCQSLLVRTSLAYIDVKGRLKTLSPVREFIRHVHPPSLTLSRPLRTYFQDLLELWKSKPQLLSGHLASELVSYLGNINELILEGLLREETSACTIIASTIIILDRLSGIMLKGDCPLMRHVPRIIQATGDPGLRWSYASARLRDVGGYRGPGDPEVFINEGVAYFNTGTKSVSQAVNFYNAAAVHYIRPRFMNIQKATEYNQLAFTLAKQADDIELQLLCLRTEYNIAHTSGDPYRAIKVVHNGRLVGRGATNFREYIWLELEARANCYMGNLSKALSVCAQTDEALISSGLGDSDTYLTVLDTQAEIHFRKSEYLEARQFYEEIRRRTSPTRSPFYHGNALGYIAYLDCLIGRETADSLENLKAAEALYIAFGSQRFLLCSCVTAEQQLYRGDNEDARSGFVECFSRSGWVHRDLSGFCLAALGDPKHRLHGIVDTFRWAVIYLAFEQKMKDPVETVNALRRLADLCSILDEEETAVNLFYAALEGGTAMDMHRLRAECMAGIGDIMIRRGDVAQAREMWAAAHPLLVRSSQMKDATAVEKRLKQLSLTEKNLSSSLLQIQNTGAGP